MTTLAGTILTLLLLQNQSIQGVVVRAGSNDPVSKAIVELRADANSGVLDRTTTEDDGRFVFDTVRPGRYKISVTRRGYARSPVTITVPAGQPMPPLRLSMSATGAIYGRIFDANGQPLGNVEVQALKATYAEGQRVLTPVQTVVTNDLGEYRLFWLSPGRYYVAANSSEAQSPTRRMVTGGFMSMGPGPNNGTFMAGGNSDPALGLFIPEAEPSDAAQYVPIFFGGTPDEQSATAIDVRPSAEFGGANIVIAPVRARHVRGVVVDGISGRPAQHASVRAERQTAVTIPDEATVDAATGIFDIALLPGSHALSVSSADGSGYAVVKVPDADVDNVRILTLPVFDISGRVTIEGQTGNSSALDSLRISLQRDSPVAQPLSSSYSVPLPNGSLTLAAAAGDFRVNVAPILNVAPSRMPAALPSSLQNAYVKSIRFGDKDVLNDGLRLERATQTALEIVIGTNPGSLTGRIMRQKPDLAADVSIVLLPDVRRRTDLYRSTTTDASGQFHFDRLPPGDYKVFAWEVVEDGAWFDPEFMQTHEGEGVRVRITEGRVESVEVPQ